MELILEGKQGKTVHVAGDAIRIVKKGLFSGRNERTLLIRNISSVEEKKPRGFAGFIQFSIAGGKARDRSLTLTGGAFDAAQDENSVLFNGEESYQIALQIKTYVESWSAPSERGAAPDPATPRSTADEIQKLKTLMDDGVLTKEEFENQKRKLLSM